MSTHAPVQEEYRKSMRAIMETLDHYLNGSHRPRVTGIAILMFSLEGAQDRVNYMSNCDRKDMLVAMKEFIARAEGMDPDLPPPGSQQS